MGNAGLPAFIFTIFVCLQLSSATEEIPVYYNVSENLPAGESVGIIPQDINILQNISTEERKSIRFIFYEETQYTAHFVINDVTGELKTSDVKIDREAICSFIDVCKFPFEISVRGLSFFAILTVRITVIDENDNAPDFQNAIDNLDISEKESVGTYFRLGEAFDADLQGKHTIQDFTLEQTHDVFTLEVVQNAEKYTFGIKLAKTLDRETTEIYPIRVVVTDGGDPILTGTHAATINILDENDNSPNFDKSVYNITIDETIVKNTVFLTVSAHDADIGENGKITYSIRNRQPNIDNIRRLFSLDPNTGALSVVSGLTHEPSEYYEFIIDATDHGEIPKTNSTLVKVTVNDVENNAPTIDINLLSPGNIGFVEIEENQPKDLFVAHVNVEDNDKGENGNFSCNVTDSMFVLEKFQGRGFKIIVSGVLDREMQAIHNVTVQCHDHGTPPAYSSDSFLVRVLDINDNDPVFDTTVYKEKMEENNNIGGIVTRVRANDIDLGRNATVEYFLATNDYRFKIDNSTGVISAVQVLDREKQDLIEIGVLAVDHGQSRRTGSATVSLTLIDVNDNAPVIVPTRPEFWIVENSPANVTIGSLDAIDLDTGDFGKFMFSLEPVEADLPFEINSNGAIRVTDTLNRELQSRYDIPVRVTDMGPNKLSNTQLVTIHVTDVNDNDPIVTFPNEANDTVTFIYQQDIYNVVTTVAAYDIDSGENGSLVFRIVGGNDDGIFEIDPKLGEVSIVKYIDIKADLNVLLEIEVKDMGIVSRSTRCVLKIDLLYTSSTGAQQLNADSGNTYVIITAVVIGLTLAVAAAIIAIILVIRRKDIRKSHEEVCARYSDSGISSGTESHPEVEGSDADDNLKAGKKKKEVSFEYPLQGTDGGRNGESTTDDYGQNRYYDLASSPVQHGPPTYTLQNQERIDSHMKAIKLQQYLWEAKSRSWDTQPVQPVHPLGDSESETSRDTGTCDSGRGGSEDDVSTSSPITDEKNFFNVHQEPRPQKKVQFLAPQHYSNQITVPPPVRESTPIHHTNAPPRPPSYTRSNSDMYAGGQPAHAQRLAIKNFSNPSHLPNSSNSASSSTPNHNIHHNGYQRHSFHHSEPWRDMYQNKNGGLPLRMRHDSESSFRSNDDDGGSTTTSGSYTLDQTELDLTDMYTHQKHLVV